MLDYNEIVCAESSIVPIPRVTEVKPLDGYRLSLVFSDGEERLFDMRPYLDKEAFIRLRDINVFNAVTINSDFGSIEWLDGSIDIATETLYRKIS